MTKRGNYLFVEKNGDLYTVSMTPELQDDIGTVGYAEFAQEDQVEKDDALLNIEASKTVMEIQSPLKGSVVERHTEVVDQPSLLNSAKSEENWIVRLKDVDPAEFDALEEA
ncbi:MULTISPECIES: glycine cleavage system H family protein [Aerococcus]|uniref:glycine cleavage system protein H n=1 Tax=Aerococcus urinae (strain CCUG 59500 / ACS-120-V-Col10a) TaxID=2976812 RepID=UPI000200F6F7|nr:biotin/lipoyl-containing protein [Aerococcus sp. Group 1]AEA00776.1 glycine cleavage H-protein [Aerococcus sp. Group 1]MCY3031261.1 glycine cleavage system protein H [Aerococcus sp. Group 1]MCY3055244.1 glycine cleavage system protein H [Aerococcus sp. Group 1]MCY3056974.1 glycine cleavage system protein H [Aerococcus sp. Group 1]MCY3062210.1 glycine cleavage system protein H [Aerococcus sp. Group 1]